MPVFHEIEYKKIFIIPIQVKSPEAEIIIKHEIQIYFILLFPTYHTIF